MVIKLISSNHFFYRSSSPTKNWSAMFTTAWRPAQTQRLKVSLTTFSVLSDVSWLRWKRRDRRVRWPKFSDFTMWRLALTRCQSTRRFKTCFQTIVLMTTRPSKWEILNWFIKFLSWLLPLSLKYWTTLLCGHSCGDSCRSCHTKSVPRSKTSNVNSTVINITTCHGISARNWRTIGWGLA